MLGVDLKLTREMKDALMNGNAVLRIGFTRINFNYFLADDEINYILDALQFVAEYGYMLLPYYNFDKHRGTWFNRDSTEKKLRSWIGEIDYSSGEMKYTSNSGKRGEFPFHVDKGCVKPFKSYIDEAYSQLVSTVGKYHQLFGKSHVDQKMLFDEQYHYQIWFVLPSSILEIFNDFKYQGPLTFEALKKFHNSLKSQDSEEWNMPFSPIDFNKETKKTHFSQEYH